MEYFEYCNYQDMSKNPTKYFEKKKVVNFDIIHHEFHGDPLKGSYKDYKTISKSDVKEYPKIEKNLVLAGVFRNIDRKDMGVKKDIIMDYF